MEVGLAWVGKRLGGRHDHVVLLPSGLVLKVGRVLVEVHRPLANPPGSIPSQDLEAHLHVDVFGVPVDSDVAVLVTRHPGLGTVWP